MDFWISFANFFASAIRLTAPIALGTLACTISERAGVINIGIEGSMLFSGFLAAVGSYYTGSPWVGLLCGCAAGAFLALILGVLAIYCNGQQIVIGIGLNLFGPGFAYMLMDYYLNKPIIPKGGRMDVQEAQPPTMPVIPDSVEGFNIRDFV